MAYRESDNTGDVSDEALVALAMDGDRDAFSVLARRYEIRLYNYLRRMTGNVSDAEDLTQETFLRAWRHIGRFREGSPVKPWLYAIATNLGRDLLRARKRHGWLSLFQASPAETLAAPDPAPDTRAGASERLEKLEQAVAALPHKHREVFLLARYEELAYAEIAETLGIPVGTVKSRMNKCVDLLAKAMEEWL